MVKTKHKVWTYAGITLLVILYVLINNVNLNPLYQGSALFYAVVITLYVGAWGVLKLGGMHFVRDENSPRVNVQFGDNQKFPKWAKWLLIAVWAFLIVVTIASSVIFNVNAYKNQMTEPIVGEFTDDIQPMDLANIPIVDKELAKKLAEKKLGENPSLGSQTHIGTPTIQQVNGKLIWAVPLQHSGLFKWLSNLDGTPGYIIVSATDTQDVQLVEGHKIKYQPDCYLFDDLERHTRFFGGGLFTGMTDYSFELDDDGNPFWVITTYKNLRGFALPEATGAILVNATTGESHTYTLADVPEWVDRVQPESFVLNQINNRGEYVRGFLNFSNKDKFTASDGHIIVYNDGNCYLFTGLTSVGADDSTIGFIMVDMVTKESYQYNLGGGATEEAAQKSAAGKVQQYGYYASFPLIININNTPTYFMTLKDNEGLIKQYAFVSVKNYQIVGVGETISATQKDYVSGLTAAGSEDLKGDETTQEEKVSGTVTRIASEVKDGQTTYKFLLDTSAGTMYISSANVSEELALTSAGDAVEVTFSGKVDNVVTVVGFDNKAIG